MGHRTFLYGLTATTTAAPLTTWGICQAPTLAENPGVGPITVKISTLPLVDAVTTMIGGVAVDTRAITDTLHPLREFVKDITHNEPFSQFALTWSGDGDLQLYVHTERGDGSSSPWFHADSHDPMNNSERPGAELLFVRPTRHVQVLIADLNLLEGLDPHNIIGIDNLSPTTIGGSLQDLVSATTALSLNAVQTVFIDGVERVGEVVQPVAYESSIADVPNIISRTVWGADESTRSGLSSYSIFKGTYIHHIAGSNNYSESRRPAIVRSTCAYHAKTLGWGDAGYNALVNKYGSIYGGRYGSLDKNIEGAHAGGFDNGVFDISVMGNHDQLEIPDAAIAALGGMVGQRIKVSDVDPMSAAALTSAGYSKAHYSSGQTMNLPAIFGHRGTGYTSCPDSFGYQQMDTVRAAARAKFDGADGADIADHSMDPNNQDGETTSIPPIPGTGESSDNGGPPESVETPTPGEAVDEFLTDSLPINSIEAT